MMFNTSTSLWEELNVVEKVRLMGYMAGGTKMQGVIQEQRAITSGRAMDGHTMRWLGALLHTSRA